MVKLLFLCSTFSFLSSSNNNNKNKYFKTSQKVTIFLILIPKERKFDYHKSEKKYTLSKSHFFCKGSNEGENNLP